MRNRYIQALYFSAGFGDFFERCYDVTQRSGWARVARFCEGSLSRRS